MTVEPAFAHLNFKRPTVLTNAPGANRMFVTEQEGKIYSLDNDPQVKQPDLVIDLKKSRPELTAIYGLTFHPDYSRNRQVFICYVLGRDQPDGTRVSRFAMKPTEPPQLDPDSEQLIITWKAGGHNGGCLKFGPDGYLYITTGDGAGPSPPDTLRAGQDVTNLLSAILRIDVDRPEKGAAYRIPQDNPLVEVNGARGEIWSYGYRNPWKMSFDRQTGDLWVGDVGWELWEMIYRVKKGGNYGWSIMEGRQPVLPEQDAGPTPILPPTIDHPHSEAASITGGFVYRGRRLKDLIGAYIYGDYQSGILWAARMKGDQLVSVEELAHTSLQLVGFSEDNAGELYLLDYQGKIYRLIENPQPDNSRHFPRKLSETGLFASTASQHPATGVLPYSINARHWADYTTSQRWMAIPGSGPIKIDKPGNWNFPEGAVLAKTVSIEMQRGAPSSTRRLETQVLHRESGSWRPYTYAWNQEQTDAELVGADGFDRTLKIRDRNSPAAGADNVYEQTYRFASRRECTLCHNPWVDAKTTIFGVQSASPLGVHAAQLNRNHRYPGGTANQMRTLHEMGILEGDLERHFKRSPPFADPYDSSADVNLRARAYLHVNCAHCHQFNAGGAATILLSHDVKLKDAKMLDVRPTQGTFGISDARIISLGDPLGSVLYYRVAKLGGGRMPRVGSREVDPHGLEMLEEWIRGLSADKNTARVASHDFVKTNRENDSLIKGLKSGDSRKDRARALAKLTSSTRGALALMRWMDEATTTGQLSNSAFREILSHVNAHPQVEVRDLFERFVPPSQRVKRLGAVVDAAEILGLPSSAGRGKQVFFQDGAAACKNCHRIRETGQPLGPDLTQIGKKYTPRQLLDHILQPSRFMEPKYIPYLLETTDGRILTGLLEKKTGQQIVLKDAQNKLHRLPAGDVELLVRQQKSLMPELLLKDMTKQQVADLLAYLAALK